MGGRKIKRLNFIYFLRSGNSRKAISPVIAVLLMIAISVAASILVYAWHMGLIGSLEGSGGTQLKQQLIMEAYSFYDTSDYPNLNIYVRNVGSTPLQITQIYFDGKPLTKLTSNYPVLNPGESHIIYINRTGGSGDWVWRGLPPNPTPGSSHILKIVTSDGAVFTFSVIAGYNG